MTLESELGYARSQPWPEGNGEHWSEDWGGSWGCWHYSIRPRLAYIGCATVVEYGCGRGQWLPYVVDDGYYYGVDCNPECIARCRASFPAGTFSESLPSKSDCEADVLMSWNSLCYSHGSAMDLVRQCSDVLSPGGTAFVHHGDIPDEVVRVAKSVGLYVSIQERVDYPTGAANCWFSTITRKPCELRRVVQSTLRDEMKAAKAISELYRR